MPHFDGDADVDVLVKIRTWEYFVGPMTVRSRPVTLRNATGPEASDLSSCAEPSDWAFSVPAGKCRDGKLN
jgi:hypothetical protein